MANKGDIYKVALPNGDEYNFKDKYVRENYRALNNNDFDTINVTELNSGNIINTGAARFLNPINGVCTDGTSGTTKYMRQDGTWAVPPNDNTTYTLDTNGNNIRLKNQGGTVISTVTAPYATSAGSATKATQDGNGKEISTTYLPRNSELLTTNPFAPASLNGPYISKIDNALYAADKRWTVTSTNTSSGLSYLFDGSYDTNVSITNGKTGVITIDFSGDGSGVFPGYPYGYILVSFYYVCKPTSITGRVYCNYEPHGIGWHDITFNPIYDNTTTTMTFRASQTYYGLQKIEITVVGDTTNSYGYTAISQIEFHLTRPLSYNNPFLSKYGAETLYYSLTAPKFIGPLQGNADSASSASKLSNWYSSRPTSMNVSFGDGAIRSFKATSTTTTGKPDIGDANIIHLAWDNNNGWDGQIAVGTAGGMMYRYQSNGTWQSWREIIDNQNIGNQSVNYATSAGSAAPTSHTHGNIQNGGTLQTTDVAIASGDKLVITDSSDSSKVARSSLAFSAAVSTQSQTTKFLREDGSWVAPSYTTNTDTKVTQAPIATDANYEILFSGSANDSTRTEGVGKATGFIYNPNTKSASIGTLQSGTILGAQAFAVGYSIEASGNGSFGQGQLVVASGTSSHAEGRFTIANHLSQHVFGEYNIADPSTAASTERGNYVEIVGNGTGSSEKSNARTLDWSGNEWLAGTLTLGGTTSDITLSGTNNTWDGTHTSLKTAVTTLTSRTYFGTCSTGASTATKVVVCPEFTTAMADCPVGTTIKVYFTNGCTATAPKLNVNSKGAVALYKYGTTVGLILWRKGSIATFTYDGTYWRMNDINDFASYVQRNRLVSDSADYFYPMLGNSHGSDTTYASLFTSAGFRMAFRTGTETTEGISRLDLGANIAAGEAGNSTGSMRIFSNTTKYGTIAVDSLTANRTYTLPDKTGTVALISDIPTTESSIKVKKNISAISDEEVNSILKLNAIKFDFKSSEENNAIHRGFIAEDVAKILPNLVTDEVVDDDGNLVDPARLNYMEMIPYLVEVCKRQQKEIDELKSLIGK